MVPGCLLGFVRQSSPSTQNHSPTHNLAIANTWILLRLLNYSPNVWSSAHHFPVVSLEYSEGLARRTCMVLFIFGQAISLGEIASNTPLTLASWPISQISIVLDSQRRGKTFWDKCRFDRITAFTEHLSRWNISIRCYGMLQRNEKRDSSWHVCYLKALNIA